MKISSIGTNFQNKQQTKNLNFKSVVPVKTSEFKKMVNTYRFVTALKALAKETKNIFDVNNIVNKTYIKSVSLDSKEYLKKSFFEDPVLFMSLAKSKYNEKSRNYTVDYSPEEIYGIIQTKKELCAYIDANPQEWLNRHKDSLEQIKKSINQILKIK